MSYDPPLLDINTSGSEEDSMEHQDDLTDFVPPTPYDSPLSGGHTPGSDEGRPNINELITHLYKLVNGSLPLGNFKGLSTIGAQQVDNESRRLKSSNGQYTINAAGVVNTATTGVSAISASVTTTGVSISIVEPRTPLTTTITAFEDEDLTIAQTLVKMRKAKDAALIEQMEDIQAKMDVDELLAERLQQEEREQFTIEEKSRMLVEMIPEMKSRKGKAKGCRKKTVTRKRIGKKLDDESVKRQKIEDDAEKEELRAHLDIIPRDDEAINVESLATKYPIVDWKTHVLSEDKMQDVLDLYRLVKERFETASLEGYDRIAIHMLIEKTYPLTQEMLSRLLSRRLEVNHECEMAYALLRLLSYGLSYDLVVVQEIA
ncbi:hypothetical protein Tco_1328028 [Tanacetum coccineum]